MRRLNTRIAVMIVMVLLMFLFCACGQKPIDTSEFGVSSFPLETGNRWEYVRTFYRIPFNVPEIADTIEFSIIRRVIGPDADSILPGAFIVDDSVLTHSGLEPDRWVERAWLTFDDDHLLEHARQFIYPWGPGTFTVFDPPIEILDFPLQEGKSWLLYDSEFGPVYCRVIDSDYYYLGDVPIFCNVVGTQSDFLEEYGVVVNEWYSELGLVYGFMNYGIRMYTDEIGQPIDSVYEYEETRLIEMNLMEE